jgi:4-hydroxy-tetrahydrodipicolinate synthase
MTNFSSSAPLRGIVPPLATPLLARDRLDVEGFERLIEHVLAGGVHALFILGTTGEAPSLSHKLRREVINHACRITRRRIPVLVGITDTTLVESVDLARHAAAAGAQAIVASAPYYFPIEQFELLAHFRHLLKESPLPLFLYNIPQLTKTHFAAETVRNLMDLDQVVGIKDSSGDTEYLRKLLDLARARPGWSVVAGQESLLPAAIQGGGHGGVIGGANAFPKLFVQWYDAILSGDRTREEQVTAQVTGLRAIYPVGGGAPSVIKTIKAALSLTGICGDLMAEPLQAHAAPEKERIRVVLEKLGLLAGQS